MSRKTIMTVLAVIGAIGAVVSNEFGLTVQLGTVVAGIGAILVYVFGEMKADFARVKTQASKFKDVKFLTTCVSAALAALANATGWEIPTELIIGLLTLIVGILFKKQSAVPA